MGFPDTGTCDIPTVNEALAAIARSTLTDPDGMLDELISGLTGGAARSGHICVNVWAFDRDLTLVLLVEHPRFGWTNPGGHLNPGEHPSVVAARELFEETGLRAELAADAPVALVGAIPIPAKGAHPEHIHYTLSYAFYADPTEDLFGETGQAVCWFPLDETLPEGFFGDNWRAAAHARTLGKS